MVKDLKWTWIGTGVGALAGAGLAGVRSQKEGIAGQDRWKRIGCGAAMGAAAGLAVGAGADAFTLRPIDLDKVMAPTGKLDFGKVGRRAIRIVQTDSFYVDKNHCPLTISGKGASHFGEGYGLFVGHSKITALRPMQIARVTGKHLPRTLRLIADPRTPVLNAVRWR